MAERPLSRAEVSELKEIFNLVDKDGGGTITTDELTELMETLGIATNADEIGLMMQELDDSKMGGNDDGEIQFEEFKAIMSRKVSANFTSDQVKSSFKIFEDASSKDGFISTKALVEALTTHGTTKLSVEEASELVSQLEPDAAGNINYIDYVNMMMHD